MEIILYITGGIALLALSWLFIALARAVSGVRSLTEEARADLRTIVASSQEVKEKVFPILGNVTNITDNVTTITGNVSSITEGFRGQMVGVHKTIDDALDVVRGTLDDLERLKDEIVATVEGPVTLVRDTSGGFVSTAVKLVSSISKLVRTVKSRNGQFQHDHHE